MCDEEIKAIARLMTDQLENLVSVIQTTMHNSLDWIRNAIKSRFIYKNVIDRCVGPCDVLKSRAKSNTP